MDSNNINEKIQALEDSFTPLQNDMQAIQTELLDLEREFNQSIAWCKTNLEVLNNGGTYLPKVTHPHGEVFENDGHLCVRAYRTNALGSIPNCYSYTYNGFLSYAYSLDCPQDIIIPAGTPRVSCPLYVRLDIPPGVEVSIDGVAGEPVVASHQTLRSGHTGPILLELQNHSPNLDGLTVVKGKQLATMRIIGT